MRLAVSRLFAVRVSLGPVFGWLTAASILPLVLAIPACSRQAPPDERPLVVVSVLPHQDVVEQLAGDSVRVEVMLPPGASPATYEPTLRQLRTLSEADLYVKVGHPSFAFETTWLEPLLAEASAGDLLVVDAPVGRLRHGDPHTWLAPQNVEALAVFLTPALASLLPDEQADLEAALARFRTQVDVLDGELRQILLPVAGRAFLVQHPSFGYFADAYGLVQLALEREHREPDAFELAQLVDHARAAGVRTVFVQPQFDASGARVVAQELGAEVVEIDPLAPEWEQNLRDVARRLAEAMGDG